MSKSMMRDVCSTCRMPLNGSHVCFLSTTATQVLPPGSVMLNPHVTNSDPPLQFSWNVESSGYALVCELLRDACHLLNSSADELTWDEWDAARRDLYARIRDVLGVSYSTERDPEPDDDDGTDT